VLVFPFCFPHRSTAAFQTTLVTPVAYLEPPQASFALRFKSLLMMLRPASEEFYRSSRILGIFFRLVPTILTCPAWETLLVAMLPPG